MAGLVILVGAPAFYYPAEWLRPPLGLLYLGATLRQQGIPVKVFDLMDVANPWSAVERAAGEAERCLVGFTCDSDNIHRVLRLSDRLLSLFPSLSVVLGGPHVTHIWDPYITERRMVVRAEGEYPLLLLAKYFLFHEGSLDNIPSIAYAKDGAVVCNPLSRGPYEDIDALPFPDYSLLQSLDLYRAAFITSRGCAYNCYFCSEGNQERGYRPRSIENVEQELLSLKAQYSGKIPYLSIADDTFTYSPRRVEELCEVFDRIFPDKSRFGFFCEGRANILARHPELIDRLKRAGLLRFQIGIESGDQKTLDRMNKQIRLEELEKVVAKCQEAEIPVIHGAFICGLPGQTEAEIMRDLEFAKRLIDLAPGRIELEMVALSPLPGTEFHVNASKWGLRLLDPDYVGGVLLNGYFSETSTLSREDIERLCGLFNAEINSYALEKCSWLPAGRIKESLVFAAERLMTSWLVGVLESHVHVSFLLDHRRREDHRFLYEVPEERHRECFPLRMLCNQQAFSDGYYFINQNSPFQFRLAPGEMKYYGYFNGKLSFRAIALRLSGEDATAADRMLGECLDVYRKCEDKLAAITIS